MEKKNQEPILNMLKVLADESRLNLLQVLYEGERTVGDLARQVDLSEPTVSHHLSRLRKAGFVSLRMAGNQRFYRLNEPGLNRFKQMADKIEQAPPRLEPTVSDDQWIEALGWSADDRKVLHTYTSNRQLIRLPSKRKNLLVILRWLATLFKPDRHYTEAAVNEVIKGVYAQDYVSLRRDLVDLGYLRRERGGGDYWLAPVEE